MERADKSKQRGAPDWSETWRPMAFGFTEGLQRLDQSAIDRVQLRIRATGLNRPYDLSGKAYPGIYWVSAGPIDSDLTDAEILAISCAEASVKLAEAQPFVAPGPVASWKTELLLMCVRGLKHQEGTPSVQLASERQWFAFAGILRESLDIIKSAAPNYYSEIEILARELVVVSGRGLISSTHPKFFGSIILNSDFISDPIEGLRSLVHETAHLSLCLREDLSPLAPPNLTGVSPLRADARPLSRIIHAAYVSLRIADALSLVRVYFPLLQPERVDYDIRGALNDVKHCLEYLNGAILHSLGRKIVAEIKIRWNALQ